LQAATNRQVARSGGDPLAHKAKAQLTFEEATERYLTKIEAEIESERHLQNWGASLRIYAFPQIGRTRVSDISRSDVLRVLEPIWETKTDTARRVRGRIEAVLNWATVAGYREGPNPAVWSGNLAILLGNPSKVAKAGHFPAVALRDVSAWWAALAQREGTAARALQFLALTAARSGEVRGMTWDEIDLEERVRTVPADRMKAGKEHRVPLTTEAVAILEALPRTSSPFVFAAPRGGMLSDMSVSAVMRRMQEAEEKAGGRGYLDPASGRPAVPHGLRSTFRDWAAEKTNYPGDMAELALAHKIGNAVEAAYRRGDMFEKRRRMMADWAAFLRGEVISEVVPLRA
jgi:integrase